MTTKPDALRVKILKEVSHYFKAAFPSRPFVPGVTPVPVSGRVFDRADLQFLVEASLDFWLTTGRFAREFEAQFARTCGRRHALLVNSGSSANLLALACLTSPSLGSRALCPGDEVITPAAAFPTTVNPIIQNGLVPVFIDVTIPAYNLDIRQLERAVGPKTKAIIAAHMLGNPFEVKTVAAFARRHGLWMIEDCCDALGARYGGRQVGTFGDLATFSFYPAHHITMGEGGCVVTDNPRLKRLVASFRDWGRDCWCDPGCDNTCRKRFQWKLGDLPRGYDHKYTYAHLGYNLKATDMQAAVGVSQLKKLKRYIRIRNRHFAFLAHALGDLDDVLILPRPTPGSEPSWFGFPLAVRPEAPFSRDDIVRELEARRVGTRLLFGGNLVRQPAYRGVRFRQIGALPNSDFVMNRVFWIGVYPGLTSPMLRYAVNIIRQVCRRPPGRCHSPVAIPASLSGR